MKLIFNFADNQITIEGNVSDLIAVLEAARTVAPRITEIKLTTASPSSQPLPGPAEESQPDSAKKNRHTINARIRSLSFALKHPSASRRLPNYAKMVQVSRSIPSAALKQIAEKCQIRHNQYGKKCWS